MKSLFKVLILSLTLIIVLTGCGRSAQKDLVGAWKFMNDENETMFMEFSEERMIIREDDEAPETVDYRLTELQKGDFIVDIAEPGTNTFEFFLEGKFNGKDKIKVTRVMDVGDKEFELVRVKDLEKEMTKEKKKQDKLTAIADKENAEKDKIAKEKNEKERVENEAKEKVENEANEKAAAAAEKKQSEEDRAAKEKEVVEVKETKTSNTVPANSSLHAQYVSKADQLREGIVNEGQSIYPDDQDMRPGFYGSYYEDWDKLLNEVWGKLKASLPANEFEQLKADQIKWIHQKEAGFAEYSDEVASSRASGMDYLAVQTTERVDYLIENYLK